MEKSLIILKPDAVRRKLVGQIISRIESKNFNIIHLKMITLEEKIVREHYEHIKSIPIFEDMIAYMISGSVVVMVVEGEYAIATIRLLVGKTSSFESPPGTIRGDFGSHRFENLIHASDCTESAEIEIKRFFPELYKLL